MGCKHCWDSHLLNFTPRICISSVFTLNAIRFYVGRICSNNVPGVVWADYRYKLMSRFPWGGSFETHLASTHEVISGTHSRTHKHTHIHIVEYTRSHLRHTHTHTHFPTSWVYTKWSQTDRHTGTHTNTHLAHTHEVISGTHTHTHTHTQTQTQTHTCTHTHT